MEAEGGVATSSAEEDGGGALLFAVVGGATNDENNVIHYDSGDLTTGWPHFGHNGSEPDDYGGTTMSPLLIMPYDSTWAPAVLQRVVTLVIIMVITLLGNGVILATLTCSRYRVRTGRTSSRVNIFILNLAVGDLTVCAITMSGELVFAVCGEWVLGEAACKLIVYGEIVALASTVFILLAMSYDRYLAICQPLRFKNSVSRARRTILLAWALALLLAVPQLFIFVQIQEGWRPDGRPVYSCKSRGYTAWWQRRVYLAFLTVCILLLPTAIITFCYASIVRVVWRQGQQQTVVASSTSTISLRKTGANDKQLSRAKVRTVKLTLCIIVAFVACWTPYFVVHNIRVHSHYEIRIAEPVIAFAETIALFNSALNPIVYGCFNLRVKKALHESCCSRRRRGPRGAGQLAPHSGSIQSGGHGRGAAICNHHSEECSSSYVEETVINAASTSTSPSGSAKLRVNHSSGGRVNNGVNSHGPPSGEQQQQQQDGVAGSKRPGSRRNKEIYEMKRRSNASRKESRT